MFRVFITINLITRNKSRIEFPIYTKKNSIFWRVSPGIKLIDVWKESKF